MIKFESKCQKCGSDDLVITVCHNKETDELKVFVLCTKCLQKITYMETCLDSKELLQKEEYEKLARIKKLVNINIDKEKSKRLKRHLRDLDYIFLNTTF